MVELELTREDLALRIVAVKPGDLRLTLSLKGLIV